MANRGYRYQAIKAAQELSYGKQVVAQIKAAKTEAEISRILTSARDAQNATVKKEPQKTECRLDMKTFMWC